MDIVDALTELSAHRRIMLSTDELKLKYGNIVRITKPANYRLEQRPDQCGHHEAYLQT